jgi:hypothetical protein
MFINKTWSIEYKNGYYLLHHHKVAEDSGNWYKSSTKTFPNLGSVSSFIEREGIISNVDLEKSYNALIKDYNIEQSAVWINNKKRREGKKVK